MSSSIAAQEIELKEYFRRAERQPDRKSPFRREAFKRLLSLAQAPDPSHKKLVTEKVKDYFVDFPDLQDEAINAVYDMCEDQDQTIRIAGYGAITSVSRADRSWLLRNADVLVQLLQSDDDKEVTIVKRALQEHVDLDPRSTLQVLSDQCLLDAADLADEEERALRARLRSLVLHFLAEKYRVCVSRVVREPEVENILLKGMIGAIPQATQSEVGTIVKEILVNLPSLSNGPTPNGNTVLNAILSTARSTLQTELERISPGAHTDLESTFFFFSLAKYLSSPSSPVARPLPTGPAASRTSPSQAPFRPSPPASPLGLLQFYTELLTSGSGILVEGVLDKRISIDAGLKLVEYVSGAYEASLHFGDRSPNDMGTLKSQFVLNVAPVLLSILARYFAANSASLRERSSFVVCLKVVRAIRERVPGSKESYATLVPALSVLLTSLLPTSAKSADVVEEDTRMGPANEEIETMEITRNLLKELEDEHKASSGESDGASSTRVNIGGKEQEQDGPPVSVTGKRKFDQHQHQERSPAPAPKLSLASRLSSPSPSSVSSTPDASTNADTSQGIAVRAASALTRTRSDAMDVDVEKEAERAKTLGAPQVAGGVGVYDDTSPRPRKRARGKGESVMDDAEPQTSGGAVTPTLLSRLVSSSPAPVVPAQSARQTSAKSVKPHTDAGSVGVPSIAARISGTPVGAIGASAQAKLSNARVNASSRGQGSAGGEQTAHSITHSTNWRNTTSKGSATGRKPRELGRRASFVNDISILGASADSGDEIKIRGAAQRGSGDRELELGSGGGNSLLARLGDGGGGGGGDWTNGDYGWDRKRKYHKSYRS